MQDYGLACFDIYDALIMRCDILFGAKPGRLFCRGLEKYVASPDLAVACVVNLFYQS